MPDDTAIQFGNQRYRERFRGAQRFDNKLLRVMADCQGAESSYGHHGYRVQIVVRFISDFDL